MIIATPRCQREPWSEGCTFYACPSIMCPFFLNERTGGRHHYCQPKVFSGTYVRAHSKGQHELGKDTLLR